MTPGVVLYRLTNANPSFSNTRLGARFSAQGSQTSFFKLNRSKQKLADLRTNSVPRPARLNCELHKCKCIETSVPGTISLILECPTRRPRNSQTRKNRSLFL